MKQLRFLLLPMLVLCSALSGRACDLCGCYTPQLETMSDMSASASKFYAAVGEQFTHFGTLQMDGDKIDNPTGQYLNSSITQLVAGYCINDRFAIQLNLPIIYREFKRPEGFAIDRGSESGIGDMALLLKTVAFR
ncbi:MAG: hypothetical protein QOI96_1888, partial [Verrucomicrobiota bacterium]